MSPDPESSPCEPLDAYSAIADYVASFLAWIDGRPEGTPRTEIETNAGFDLSPDEYDLLITTLDNVDFIFGRSDAA